MKLLLILVIILSGKVSGDEFKEYQRSINDIAVPHIPLDVSPKCHQNALRIIDDTQQFGGSLGGHYCRRLSYEHQQLLALELTKCHLADLGQSPFQAGPCQTDAEGSQGCLLLLNDRGFQSYTTFKVHVEQYCLKLNHELMIFRQQELGAQLQESAQLAAVQFTELVNQQGAMKEEYSHLFVSLTQQQSELHGEFLQQALQRQTQLEERALQKQKVQEQQLHEWMQRLMSGQAQEMQLQRQELQALSAAVGTTALQLKPLMGIELALEYVANGIHIGSFLVYLCIALHAIWLVTLPACVRSCRPKLFRLAMLEFALGCIILVQLEEPIQQDWVVFTSRACRILQVGTYVLSVLGSCFLSKRTSSEQEQQKELAQVVHSMKRDMEILQRQSDEREDRLIALVQEQTNSQAARDEEKRYLQVSNRPLKSPLPRQNENPYAAQVTPFPVQQQTGHLQQYTLADRFEASNHMIQYPFSQQLAMCEPRLESPAIFYDAIAVTPSPPQDFDGAGKRSRLESDDYQLPSKKQRILREDH